MTECRLRRPARRAKLLPQEGRKEPCETVVIDVDDEHAGTVVEKMAQRKGE